MAVAEEAPLAAAETGNGDDNAPQDEAGSFTALRDLAAIRQKHHARYQERERAAQRQDQEQRDAELAERLAKEEEELRLRQLEEDEVYSRQLAAQLNPGGGGSMDHPMQDLGPSAGQEYDQGDSELGAYHQFEDAGEYRAPMRTGYNDRLIEPQAAFVPFLGGGARQPNWRRRALGPAVLMPLACVGGVFLMFLVSMAFWGGN
mmetsp:Transcript_81524/g.189349  ORF Transcript_81524/g.189349 Transcript_81524/m.189349 type:complete len:203 (-) Transcript_81524:82-690(-)|eukprot:CAMPEP_0171090064 /NCGR_PEP_ID=MMETSP0766_2-20121228/28623_1 /TAXON_ID=439317 /ORGANISM="Gambierdiscus australes, Strain CAWD 149" /LENGTH=202 /DNA_ID=CAMNT_0011548013 /DNA_START=51 /DNA_END=659 /DNA_ORIENTATION=+